MSTPTSSQEGRHGGQRHRNQGCKLVGAGGGAEQILEAAEHRLDPPAVAIAALAIYTCYHCYCIAREASARAQKRFHRKRATKGGPK